MRIAFSLGGTDLGRSGLGMWARAVLPRLDEAVRDRGGSLVVLGEGAELSAYDDVVGSLERFRAPHAIGGAVASALWHLVGAGRLARRASADVLLLPAANRRASAWSPLPVVAVVHDFANFKVAGQSDPARNAYRRWLVLRALRTATELVAVSGATRDDLASLLGPGAPPMRVVGNGVDTDRFVPRSPTDPLVIAARSRAGLGARYILYPARLEHPAKNHERLLAAFLASKACADHELALCGAEWGAGPRIERDVVRLGLQDRVKRIGFVPAADLPLLVAGANAVAMVGLYEGFGLPALEALAAGRPVIASTTGALPEVVGELAAPCDPTDVGSIALALDRALTDETLRTRCAEEGPAWARAHSWEGTARGLLQACETAMSRARS